MKDENSTAGHLASAEIAAYVLENLSPAKQEQVEEHCLLCEECSAQLAILMRASAFEENGEAERRLEALLPLGQQAAAWAREQASAHPASAPSKAEKASPRTSSAGGRGRFRRATHWLRSQRRWPYLPHALAALA